jgi:polyisoprenyl-phosphate glycosyltransferase
MPEDSYTLSVVVPVYNEVANIDNFHPSLIGILGNLKNPYEVIYVDDGSTDGSGAEIKQLAKNDKHVKLVALTKNFGKEIALSAGLQKAKGDAVITIDADGQHPVELIPTFINKWRSDRTKVVVGLRTANQNEGFVKHFGSKLFYKLFNSLTRFKLVPGSTDFRLIDREVCAEFCKLTERNRITRGLVDWLGYQTAYIEFTANPRLEGDSGYSTKKLIKLALTSFISLSFIPLYTMGYIGLILTPLSLLVGVFMVVEDLILHDPLHLNLTGSGFLGILTVFLVGLVLISQGLMALYISYIYEEVRNRPLFVVDTTQSIP